LTEGIDGSVDFLEFAAGGIFDDARPGFIGFAEGQGVGMTGASVAAEGLVGDLGDVRSGTA
jgi:hypothetical protein